MAEKRSFPERFRDASGETYLDRCIECDAKIMSAQDSIAGVICANPGCRENAPRKWQEMAQELSDAKESLADAVIEERRMKDILCFIHKYLRRKENEKGETAGTVELPESILHAIDEIVIAP